MPERKPIKGEVRRMRGARLARAYEGIREEGRREYEKLSRVPLFSAGVAMFWMGGTKALLNQVKFSSTDPYKISSFLAFLSGPCGVGKEQVKVSLLLYPDIDPESARRFWSFAASIPLSGFYKIGTLPARKKAREASQGLCTLIVHSAALRRKLGVWTEMLSRELKETP